MEGQPITSQDACICHSPFIEPNFGICKSHQLQKTAGFRFAEASSFHLTHQLKAFRGSEGLSRESTGPLSGEGPGIELCSRGEPSAAAPADPHPETEAPWDAWPPARRIDRRSARGAGGAWATFFLEAKGRPWLGEFTGRKVEALFRGPIFGPRHTHKICLRLVWGGGLSEFPRLRTTQSPVLLKKEY